MLDWSDTGRWDAGHLGRRTGRMQERRDAGKDRGRKRGMQDRRD